MIEERRDRDVVVTVYTNDGKDSFFFFDTIPASIAGMPQTYLASRVQDILMNKITWSWQYLNNDNEKT